MAYVYSDELCHYGVLGMKWGIRRYQNSDGSLTSAGKKRYSTGKTGGIFKRKSTAAKQTNKKTSSEESTQKKKTNELTNDELAARIRRMELEQRYSQLTSQTNVKQVSAGRKFVNDVLYQSGKQVATQLATYAIGTAVNKALGSKVINVKEAQKAKKDD